MAGLTGAATAQRASTAPEHIVDTLIRERAPRLTASPLWPVLRPAILLALGYGKARAMADAVATMGGAETLDYASDLLHLKIETSGFDRIPRQGRLIVVINHPTGLAEGVAVYDALKPIRPDLKFFANADAIRVCPRFGEIVIPVEWVEAKRSHEKMRATLEAARAALEAERPLVISPAGRVARYLKDGLPTDPPWQASAASLARRYKAPIVPLHIQGPSSTLFRVLNLVSREMSDITLFHELLNKAGGRFRLVAGPVIPPEAIQPDAAGFTERLKPYVERGLARDPDLAFR